MPTGVGFEVAPAQLATAGAAARDAGAQVGAIDLAGDANAIGAAMPGSSTAAASGPLAASWTRGIRGWSQAAIAHGDGLTASGTTYTGDDASASAVVASVPIPGLG